ncbi:protein farnesyltransferase subunit beta [Nematocida ausubeli]|nr:protein farnesyltransferase subunit beta [Nematocida ausubeli]KAI5164045.1 protein farnesyltransferase subunit beta [Nematocida ausubeli]
MYDDEGLSTKSSVDAIHLNSTLKKRVSVLDKDAHIEYLIKQMNKPLNIGYTSLVPWVSSWIANALYVILGREEFYASLNHKLSKLHDISLQIVGLQQSNSGISPDRSQLPNLGCTYAGLVFLKVMKKDHMLDRDGIIKFITEMKVKDGFTMYSDGEIDPRSIYCAVATYSILHSDTISEDSQFNPLSTPEGKELFGDTVEILKSLQTYEGGFAAAPGEEAHAGYSYCVIAALKILGVDVSEDSLLRNWLLQRQDEINKGFTGRTNKTSDSCYNFWVGASYRMLGLGIISNSGLAEYTFCNCQDENGGVKNIPESHADVYHTAYALIGLYIVNENDFNYVLGMPV